MMRGMEGRAEAVARRLTGLQELDLRSCRRLTALPEWLGELRSLQKCAEVGS